jgi:phosphatidate cytidylyltransferase
VALFWAPIALGAIYLGGAWFMVLVGLFGVIALRELYVMLAPLKPLVPAGILALIGLVAAAEYGSQFQIVLVLVLSVVGCFAVAVTRTERRWISLSIAATLLGVVWIGLGMAHAVLLRELEHGDGLMIDVLLGTFIGDSAAYFGGRTWGMRELSPRISPNKTVEGLLAGFVVGTAAFWFAGLYQDWLSGLDALAIGACVAAVAPLGDLFESMIKRDLGVKDTGRFFGPHGGVLDRIDAALFTVVVGYYMSVALV